MIITKVIVDLDLSIEECGTALKYLANNKSSGLDEFTTSFYKKNWPDIKTLLHDSYIFSFQNNLLTNEQRR